MVARAIGHERCWRPALRLIGLVLAVLAAACAGDGEPAGANALFADNFVSGETGAWRVEADDLGKTAIEGEQLVVELRAPETIQYATLEEPPFADLVLEVDATIVSGSVAGSYGLMFRVQDGGAGFYRFNITGTGFYILERYDADGTWARLTDGWVESPAIKTGLNATNRLKVIVGGPNILLFVNGEPLGQFTDANGHARGRIALDAGTFGSPDLRVAFDNVVVREP